jgi:hypothetical protein
MRRITITCLTLIAAALLVLPAVASAAPKKRAKASAPQITRVQPMRVSVGNVLTITGRRFKANRSKNTIIFRSASGRTAFAKPRRATARKLVVVVPGSVARLLRVQNSRQQPTRLRLRVLAGKFSKFTPRRLSPVVTSAGDGDGRPGGGGPGGGGVSLPCTSGPDHDGDMLPNTREVQLNTDVCLPDTDGDGVQDGFEYKSAVDLNNDDYQEPNQSLPYPGKRPYPNPLDPSDGNTDFDGDTLELSVEQNLWYASSNPADRQLDTPLTYSDGLQHSIYEFRSGQGNRRFPALPAAGYSKQVDFVNWATSAGYRNNLHVPDPDTPGASLVVSLFDFDLDSGTPEQDLFYDMDGSGFLADHERDEDADGMTNFDENDGRTQASWWAGCYEVETPYYITYTGTDLIDPDTDGDGVRDGADDQDHDDFPNVMELSRIAASGIDDREIGETCQVAEAIEDMFAGTDPPWYWHEDDYGRVNPFNPCLPVTHARTCNQFPRFDQEWAPYDQSPNWYSLN